MEHIDWVARSRELAARFSERAARHDREGSFPFENFDELRDTGFLKLTVPVERGGFGASLSLFLRTQEELARGDGSTALALNMHQVRLGGECESPTYPARWLDEMCRGAVEHGWLCNTVATEEGLGSPAGGGLPATVAREHEGGWVIDGRKTFVTMAPLLHYFILTARIDSSGPEESGPVDLGTFMLLPEDPGMTIVETWDSLGMRATGSHDLLLEACTIPTDRLMGRKAHGAPPSPAAAATSTWFALGVSATTIGVATATRDYAVSFARTRVPTGLVAIRQFPGVRAKVARMDLLLQRSRALVYDAARAWESRAEDGMPPADRVAVAKVETLNACIEAVDIAMRVVGGVSLQKSRPIERYYRDVRAALHNPPLEDRALEQLARRALE